MSTTPCGDQTQLSSLVPSTFRYLPATISCCHSTREKLMRHCSPSRGGTGTFVSSFSPFQGQAISTVQPLSLSLGSLIVPFTFTAVFKPAISHAFTAWPPSLYGIGSSRSQVVLSAFNSNSPYMWL